MTMITIVLVVLILVLVEHTLGAAHSDLLCEGTVSVLILVLVEHTLREQLLQRTLFQSITLVNSEYLSVFNRKNVPLTLQRYEIFGETRAPKRENIIILRP